MFGDRALYQLRSDPEIVVETLPDDAEDGDLRVLDFSGETGDDSDKLLLRYDADLSIWVAVSSFGDWTEVPVTFGTDLNRDHFDHYIEGGASFEGATAKHDADTAQLTASQATFAVDHHGAVVRHKGAATFGSLTSSGTGYCAGYLGDTDPDGVPTHGVQCLNPRVGGGANNGSDNYDQAVHELTGIGVDSETTTALVSDGLSFESEGASNALRAEHRREVLGAQQFFSWELERGGDSTGGEKIPSGDHSADPLRFGWMTRSSSNHSSSVSYTTNLLEILV